MDIDIIPILAPLTLLGVALAIGVQSIVKDFFSGFFMLLEDAFAVGDLVIINGQMGRIESLTVRVVRLRATDGSLYTFPYGNITSLCNQNRDFSAAVILFEVGIEADMNKVYEILEKISKDLRKDPKTRSLVVDSVQIDGINEVSDNALQIRAVIKTKPSMHYKVKWAFNHLLKQYLESYGIPGPTPRQLSYNYTIEK
jgi:small conductance mechanosensitive channel